MNGFVFLLPVIEVVDLGPLGPGIVRLTCFRRTVKDLKLHEALASLSHGCANAVGAGIAAADDNHILALSRDKRITERVVTLRITMLAVKQVLGVGMEELDGKMNAFEVASFDGEVARLGRATAQHDRIEFLQEFIGGIVLADLDIRDELNSLRRSSSPHGGGQLFYPVSCWGCHIRADHRCGRRARKPSPNDQPC